MDPIATLKSLYASMWEDAQPEQRKLTTQLVRNSFYFTAAAVVIRAFGDQLAV